jgi:hypothetical protein
MCAYITLGVLSHKTTKANKHFHYLVMPEYMTETYHRQYSLLFMQVLY